MPFSMSTNICKVYGIEAVVMNALGRPYIVPIRSLEGGIACDYKPELWGASDVALLLVVRKRRRSICRRGRSQNLMMKTLRELHKSELGLAILIFSCLQDRLFDHVVEKINKKIPLISFGIHPAHGQYPVLPEGHLYCKRLHGLWGTREHSQHDPLHRPRGSWVRLQLRSTPKRASGRNLPSRFQRSLY